MNRRQRQAKYERVQEHQARAKRRKAVAAASDAAASLAAVPRARRRRPLPKRVVREMGRKIRPERMR